MYSFTSTVRYSECDTSLTLSIPSLINYMQDCSTFHTESIGHGIAWCTSLDFAWFVSAWQIRINRLPRFTEEIRVSTWSNPLRPTMASRRFLVETTAGETLALADSLWFPFHLKKQRPVRIPESEFSYINEDIPIDLPPLKRKLKLVGEGVQKSPIMVVEHHLDTNNHVNNGQYIAMADTLVHAEDPTFPLGMLYVQYKQAAKLGDVIVPHLYKEEMGYAVDLANENGTSFAIVRMERAN